MAKGKLNNKFTHFGGFTWAECPKIRKALYEVKEKLAAQGKPLPVRFKIKL